jgi:hypothetical protein
MLGYGSAGLWALNLDLFPEVTVNMTSKPVTWFCK